ncbi:MAG: hypothetical protein SFW65_00365 [Alphaproteobacteria bacterium]|nr:hypothetical protein [Alphaproteobacteria bacterium]
MPSPTADILTRALLAKAPMFGKLDKAIKELSRIDIQDVMECPAEYLGAVANLVDIDLREAIEEGQEPDTLLRAKRAFLMEYLRERKNRPESCGAFLNDMAMLITNVQRVWLRLAAEVPRTRIFQIAPQFPELILPMSFGMKFYFAQDIIDPNLVTVVRSAAQTPEEALRLRRTPLPHEHIKVQ